MVRPQQTQAGVTAAMITPGPGNGVGLKSTSRMLWPPSDRSGSDGRELAHNQRGEYAHQIATPTSQRAPDSGLSPRAATNRRRNTPGADSGARARPGYGRTGQHSRRSNIRPLERLACRSPAQQTQTQPDGPVQGPQTASRGWR